jgi:hypothetical protein
MMVAQRNDGEGMYFCHNIAVKRVNVSDTAQTRVGIVESKKEWSSKGITIDTVVVWTSFINDEVKICHE